MARKDYTFTSESVSEGHPDKICDRISDAVLDFCLEKDSFARVACETFATTNTVVVGGEVGFKSDKDSQSLSSEINSLVVNVVKEIEKHSFSGHDSEVPHYFERAYVSLFSKNDPTLLYHDFKRELSKQRILRTHKSK